MSEVEAPAAVAASPKKAKTAAKKPRSKPAHPKTADMVDNAIKNLKERGGSSLQAIKKYITANYKVDAEKLSPFIKKYLKSSVTNGKLVQTKGKGASGSFKLASKEKSEKGDKKPKPAAAATKKTKSPKKPAAAKKAVAPKKPAGEKKAKAPKKAAAPKKVKSPSKAKKATKAPAAKKPKTPKPKKAAAKPKAAKKAAPKKK